MLTLLFFLATNLDQEQELQELREDVAEKVQTVEALKARYDKLIQQYNQLSEVFAPEHIRDCLRESADESQEQSETIAQDFLNRKIDVERFLSTYVECRKLGQARRTKEEKLAHQLNELKRTGRYWTIEQRFFFLWKTMKCRWRENALLYTRYPSPQNSSFCDREDRHEGVDFVALSGLTGQNDGVYASKCTNGLSIS